MAPRIYDVSSPCLGILHTTEESSDKLYGLLAVVTICDTALSNQILDIEPRS